MFATRGYVVERPKAPEGWETDPPHFRNYPQPNLPASGYNKRCIETGSNVVWTMGWGDHGRLGIGVREKVVHTPVRVMDLLDDDYDEKQEKKRNRTSADLKHQTRSHKKSAVSNISLGGRHTLVLMESGEVLACGHGRNGQLGVGEGKREEQLKPILVRFPRPLEPIDFVAAGGMASYAISRRGLVFAWGCGKQGRLGLGDSYLNRDCSHPTLIPELSSIQTTGVVCIAAGTHHAHAMTASGALYSWGLNNAGQLGLGDKRNRTKPVLVREFIFRQCTVLGIATSHQFSMAIVECPIAAAPEDDDEEEEDHALHDDVDGHEHLRVEGKRFRRRALTAPSGARRDSGVVGGVGGPLKPNDPRDQSNWSRINVRLVPTANNLQGEELDAVVHTAFRPKHFDKEFLQYEPEMLSRPHSRIGTPSNDSVLANLQRELKGAVAARYQMRAMTAPANIQTSGGRGGPLSGAHLLPGLPGLPGAALSSDSEQLGFVDERDVLISLFRACDDTCEGPHYLENKSVRENMSDLDRRKGPSMISCLAVRKKKLLYALGQRDGGPLDPKLLSLIEKTEELRRLKLLLVPNLIARRLEVLETEIYGRVTPDEVLDLMLTPALQWFKLFMTKLFDLTLDSVQTHVHCGMVLRKDLLSVMTTRNDAKIALKSEPSLLCLLRRKSYKKKSPWWCSGQSGNKYPTHISTEMSENK